MSTSGANRADKIRLGINEQQEELQRRTARVMERQYTTQEDWIELSRFQEQLIDASLESNAILLNALKQAQGRIERITKKFYCVPTWCRMHPLAHFDGMGGCWGISSGCVLEDGEDYCLDCEFHKDNIT